MTSIPYSEQVCNTNNSANVLFVLSNILSGNGGMEASRVIGMLDLPNLSIAKSMFPKIESELSKYILPFTKELLQANLLREVAMYAAANPAFPYSDWKAQYKAKPRVVDTSIMPLITIGYDMAWQKRSSGHRYDSHSGHAVPFGVLSKLPLTAKILNKHCHICSLKKIPLKMR